jgi:hypothetical protein
VKDQSAEERRARAVAAVSDPRQSTPRGTVRGPGMMLVVGRSVRGQVDLE